MIKKNVYYLIELSMINGKTKMIENDEVIQTVEKRVETISDDGWKKNNRRFSKSA